MPSSLKSLSVSKQYNDRKIDLMVTSFTDRDMIVVTELNKLGGLFDIQIDLPIKTTQVKSPTYDVKVLLGKDDDLMNAFVRAIAQNVFEVRSDQLQGEGDLKKPILCSVALRDLDKDLVLFVVDMLKSCNIWSI